MSDTPTPTPAPVVQPVVVPTPAAPPATTPPRERLSFDDDNTPITTINSDGREWVPHAEFQRRIKGKAEALTKAQADLAAAQEKVAQVDTLQARIQEMERTRAYDVTLARLEVTSPALKSRHSRRALIRAYEDDLADMAPDDEKPAFDDWITTNKEDAFIKQLLGPGTTPTGPAGPTAPPLPKAPTAPKPAPNINGGTQDPPSGGQPTFSDAERARMAKGNGGVLPQWYQEQYEQHLQTKGIFYNGGSKHRRRS